MFNSICYKSSHIQLDSLTTDLNTCSLQLHHFYSQKDALNTNVNVFICLEVIYRYTLTRHSFTPQPVVSYCLLSLEYQQKKGDHLELCPRSPKLALSLITYTSFIVDHLQQLYRRSPICTSFIVDHLYVLALSLITYTSFIVDHLYVLALSSINYTSFIVDHLYQLYR